MDVCYLESPNYSIQIYHIWWIYFAYWDSIFGVMSDWKSKTGETTKEAWQVYVANSFPWTWTLLILCHCLPPPCLSNQCVVFVFLYNSSLSFAVFVTHEYVCIHSSSLSNTIFVHQDATVFQIVTRLDSLATSPDTLSLCLGTTFFVSYQKHWTLHTVP